MRSARGDERVRGWLVEPGLPCTEALPSALQSRWIDATELPSKRLPKDQAVAAATEEVAVFTSVFGMPPEVAVPSTFVWTPDVESAWARAGVRVLVTPGRRFDGRDARAGLVATQDEYHNGQAGPGELSYVVRDDYFEPSLGHTHSRALDALRAKTRLGRPTLLEIHRLNFVGDESMARRTCDELSRLLESACARFPDIRFMSTAELARQYRDRTDLVATGLASRIHFLLRRLAASSRLRKLAQRRRRSRLGGVSDHPATPAEPRPTMSRLCGWINTRYSDDDRAAALRAMAVASTRQSGPEPVTISSPWGAMVSAGGRVPVSRHQNGESLVVIIGQARWDSADLERVAAAQGAAAAAARLYEQHGADCVKRMHGPFALAVSDGARRKGLLAIDRMAIRTMYHAPVAGGVAFASTLDGLIAQPAVSRRLSMQGVFNYLYQETVPAPGTIYEGVAKLLPGQRVIIDGTTATTDFYWQLDYSEGRVASEAALRSELLDLLRQAVARTATSDSIGAFLSGGTDSSTIVGMLTSLRGQPVDTYSIGFQAEGFDEMDYARISARHFGSRAHEYYVTPRDVAEAIPLLAGAYDEPFGNASAVPT
jgi:hypothetical protein